MTELLTNFNVSFYTTDFDVTVPKVEDLEKIYIPLEKIKTQNAITTNGIVDFSRSAAKSQGLFRKQDTGSRNGEEFAQKVSDLINQNKNKNLLNLYLRLVGGKQRQWQRQPKKQRSRERQKQKDENEHCPNHDLTIQNDSKEHPNSPKTFQACSESDWNM